jgi:hypothetical protein
MKPLANMQVLTLAINLPGPLAFTRMCQLGATAVKVEPAEGDPLECACPDWYRTLHAGQEIVRLNLKDSTDRARLDGWLTSADLLITATRPVALQRLRLAWPDLHVRYPRLCQVAIVGLGLGSLGGAVAGVRRTKPCPVGCCFLAVVKLPAGKERVHEHQAGLGERLRGHERSWRWPSCRRRDTVSGEPVGVFRAA